VERSATNQPLHDPGAHANSAVLTIQELNLKAGCLEEFVARFRALDVLGLAATAADGDLLEAAMAVSDDQVVVVTRWASERGITAWTASASRELVREQLEPFYATPPVVRRFTSRVLFDASE
jgi:heme-degrading monooxygenase HmoA